MKIELIRKGKDYLIRRRLWGVIPLWLNPYTTCGSWGVLNCSGGTWQLFPTIYCRLDKEKASEKFAHLLHAGKIERENAESRQAFQKAKEEILSVAEL